MPPIPKHLRASEGAQPFVHGQRPAASKAQIAERRAASGLPPVAPATRHPATKHAIRKAHPTA